MKKLTQNKTENFKTSINAEVVDGNEIFLKNTSAIHIIHRKFSSHSSISSCLEIDVIERDDSIKKMYISNCRKNWDLIKSFHGKLGCVVFARTLDMDTKEAIDTTFHNSKPFLARWNVKKSETFLFGLVDHVCMYGNTTESITEYAKANM